MKTIHNTETIVRTEAQIFSKGIELMERKKYSAAQKNFDILLLLHPQHIESLLNRGICKMHAGMVHAALDDFSEIMMHANGKPEAYAAMAEAYWMLADYQLAKQYIEEAFKCHTTLKSEWYALACNIYTKLNDIATAYACINRAIVCDPFEPVLYYKRARLLYRMGKTQVALNDLNKAIGFDAGFRSAYALRARCKEALGDEQGARYDQLKSGAHS